MNNNRSKKARKMKPKAMAHKAQQNKAPDLQLGGERRPSHPAMAQPGYSLRSSAISNATSEMSIPDLLDAEYAKMHKNESDLMFGHSSNLLPLIDMEDESFTNWYRKNAGMHTVETWLKNYKRHPYAWGALIMIHGVNEVSARLRSKVENYAVYSAVLLSASVVLFAMTEINPYLEDANPILKRIYLYSK
mmetsp:Transcript_210/g.444  ORF Transcript_210/g.444 Transcript_210/m.444 type:complete len:190 (+) Transcript_210:53-622(+)